MTAPYTGPRTTLREIEAPGAWDANPWGAAYSFLQILGNVDKIGGAA